MPRSLAEEPIQSSSALSMHADKCKHRLCLGGHLEHTGCPLVARRWRHRRRPGPPTGGGAFLPAASWYSRVVQLAPYGVKLLSNRVVQAYRVWSRGSLTTSIHQGSELVLRVSFEWHIPSAFVRGLVGFVDHFLPVTQMSHKHLH